MSMHESQPILDASREAMTLARNKVNPSPVGYAAIQAIGFGANFARAVRELPPELRASALAYVTEFCAEGEGSVSAMGYKSVSGEK